MIMMRYRKGSRVEVLSKDEVPSGCWRCAEVISGHGRNHRVRYDGEESIEGHVSRKLMRPCPPLVDVKDDWVPGEVLEVFHNISWKIATVSKVLGRNFFVVRLVGTSQELKVREVDLRVRQCWQDDEWVVIGKGSGNREDWKQDDRSNLKYIPDPGCGVKQTNARMNLHVKDHILNAQDDIYFQESTNVSSKILKRSLPCWYSQVEAHEGNPLKFLAAEKDGRSHRVATFPPPEKVAAVASTREMVGEKHMHASSNIRKTRFIKINVEKEKSIGAFGCSRANSLEPYNADSITCSVGSSSVGSNSPYELPCHSGPFEEKDHCSDAESFCRMECEEELFVPPTKDELAEEIHNLELHAYRCTIEALHASGPLSWEKESLVTDLRISLHISNDEHLMELRNLVSTATSISIR